MSRIPAFFVTGLDPTAMAAAALALHVDLPGAVLVRYDVDVAEHHVVRTVSDLSGRLERTVLLQQHPCATCAIRDDVLPTLRRLGECGRWQAVVVHAPLGESVLPVVRALSWDPDAAPAVRCAGTIAALDGPGVLEDLLGADILPDRALTTESDRRGVGEALGAIVERADVVALFGPACDPSVDLVRLLARPGALVTRDWPHIPADQLVPGVCDHDATEEWLATTYDGPSRDVEGRYAWRLELTAARPLHPQRWRTRVHLLGSGAFRSRGCFWLASRPGVVGVWDGAGGQVSIGIDGCWGYQPPTTRIVVTGLRDDDPRSTLRATFDECLLTDEELRDRGPYWDVAEDGFEPWLGPVRPSHPSPHPPPG